MVRDDIEHDDPDDAETTANSKGRRGGFNKDLLYNLRNRLTGKRTTSQHQAQQEAAAVSEVSSLLPSVSVSLFSFPQRQGIFSRFLPFPIPHALQQFAVEIARMQLQPQLQLRVVAFDANGWLPVCLSRGANQGFKVSINGANQAPNAACRADERSNRQTETLADAESRPGAAAGVPLSPPQCRHPRNDPA